MCLEEIANIEVVETFIDVLRRIDRPFIKSEYDASIAHSKASFGEYMRRMAMKQNRELTYSDSQFSDDLSKFASKDAKELNKKIELTDVIKFKITPELLSKWGNGYSETDIYQLEQFYHDMKDANSITTPQHIVSLKLLCKLSVKQNQALDDGDFGAFKNLNTQYNMVLKDSGFRPIDKKGSNESVGIRSFSQIWEEIEKDGFIPKHNIDETQDIVDKTILHMENYTRQFLNMQTVSTPTGETPKVDD